jgi:preprotein translocase subunit SecG
VEILVINLTKYTKIVAIIFLITILLSFIIINQDNSFTTLFNNLDIQTELFSMGIPNGNESFGVPSIQCPYCLKQGVEV